MNSTQSRQHQTEKIKLNTEEMTQQPLQPSYPPVSTAPVSSKKIEEKNKQKEKNTAEVKSENNNEKSHPALANFDEVIAKSTLADNDSAKQIENIKREFNKEAVATGKSSFSTSVGGRGDYLQKDEFLLGSRNRTPELASFNKDYNTTMAVKLDQTEIKEHGKFKHYDQYFGAHGSHVLNVPQDKFAKAMSGQKPLLFGPGPHVIKDANFRFDVKTGFVNQSETVISHANLHIIRVPRGSVAKIWIGTEPFILDHRVEPYVFDSPLFRIEKNGDNFFFTASDWVIKHGTITRLRVPEGHLAKAWDDTKPLLLSSDKAHYYDSPTFKLEATNNNYFVSASEKLIEHGSIKRIIPPINNVAIVSNGGNLMVVGPNKDGSPIELDSPSTTVDGFLDKGVQMLTFPSVETIEQRKKDGRRHPNYQVYRTKDNLEVGVTLLVGYKIIDPEKAMILALKGIAPHIEHAANVDMTKAISQSSMSEFLTFYQTKPHNNEIARGGR